MQKLIPEKEAYWIEFPKYGIIAYTQRLIGSTVMPINLREFPFDNQVIPITFESFHWKAEDLHLVRLAEQSFQLPPRKGSSEQWLTMSDQVHLPEWSITGISVRETLKHYPFEDRCVCLHCPRLHAAHTRPPADPTRRSEWRLASSAPTATT